MTLLATVKLLELVVFSVLTAVSLAQWSRRRTRAPAWLTLTFGVLAAVNVTLLVGVSGRPDPSAGHELSIQVIGLVSAVLFVVGLATPRSLRTISRRVEVERLRHAEAALMVADTIDSVSAIVLPQAVQLLGASAAVVVDSEGEVIARHGMDAAAAAAFAAGLRVPAEPGGPPLVRPNMVAIPLRSGWLAVETTTSAPFFGGDELVILESLGYFTGLAFDHITDRKATEEAMVFQALHDPLTGLPNRTMFVDRLGQALDRRSLEMNGLAVLFLDLDRFKWLNDSLGHSAGDELLIQVATRLTAAIRPGDMVARFGGDEFVVLCEELETEADAEALAARFASVVGEPMVVAGEETGVTVSTGIAFAPPGSTDCSPETLLRDADAAMYQAKERGRNCHETFNVRTRLMAITRHETVNALRLGIQRGELVVHYQPEVDVTTERVVCVEALVRWQHPERGLLAPSEFICVAEESGLIVELGRQVLEVACSEVMAWERRNPQGPPVALAVNLAARQLMSPDLCDVVQAALTGAGMPASRLCLEITESVLLEDANQSARALEQLKALGVRIGVDDFGTGFSSLTYLKRFPVDTMKIDRSFVDGLGQDREDRAIVASVVDLAHAFGLTTIAEGVETVEQLNELRTIGCEQAQGYLWSRPMPAEETERWIKARAREPDVVSARQVAVPGLSQVPCQRILIVEDDHGLRRLLRMIFEGDDGFEVVGEADDGRAAIALARHFSPDLVLLDLAMPGMGGLEALPLIRAVAPSAKVVVLSALDSVELIESARRQGAAAFYNKGGDPADLLRILAPVSAKA